MKQLFTYFLCLFIFMSCSSDNDTISPPDTSDPDDPVEDPDSSPPNILLVIADDMGLDASPGFDMGTIKPNMPNLQNLINSGVRFSNLWSNPTCTPTRSSIITGKYGFRTGVTMVGDILSTTETSIQSYLDDHTGSSYEHAVIGKWHLSNSPTHPNEMGVGYYAGLISGGVQSYWNWNLTENGETAVSTEYSTTKITDLAINWLTEQTKPWFLWLAYNAPHTPFHLPPEGLHYQGSLPQDEASIDANPLPYYMAILEAMDTEFGRLLNTLSQDQMDNTVIIFIGDNGTPNQVVQDYGSNRAKGSLYQGGINVPMVISGKDVSRSNQSEDALINTTDLFATIADIAETGTTEINDSKSFMNLLSDSDAITREYTYAETGSDGYAIRNATHKYILFSNGSEALYDLDENPMEDPNLLDADQLPLSEANSAIKDELTDKLIEIRN